MLDSNYGKYQECCKQHPWGSHRRIRLREILLTLPQTSCGRKGKNMKKKFKLEDLDCAECAAKMEDAIKKIDGVNDASVNFLMQKMTVDAVDDRFDAIMDEVEKVCAKVEPDCRILR